MALAQNPFADQLVTGCVGDANPAAMVYGEGPATEKCGTCGHLGADRVPRHRETPTGPLVEGHTDYCCRLQGAPTKITWAACAAHLAPEALPARG